MLGNKYELFINNGTKNTGINPFEFAIEMEKMGAGEIVVNSIDNDGTMKGFDLILIEKMRKVISTPLTVIGGAGTNEDLKSVIDQNGIIGVSAGSLFVFKGKFRAVLISYPNPNEKEQIFKSISS